MPRQFRDLIPIIPSLIAYCLIAWWLNFTQDDAYISYRYVANFLDGRGLVYNLGEHVEGFTNFGWVIYLILWGSLGVGYVAVSKITGFLLGGGVVVVTYFIAKEILPERQNWLRYLPVYLVGANLSLAYWSPAGLETAAFAFITSLALLWYLRRSRFLIFAMLMAVWIRPDGAVVAGLLVLAEAVSERSIPKFTLSCAIVAFVLSLPFLGFKYYYYGGIAPNPFYAKTGISSEYIASGLEYAGQFFAHYGFLGIGLLIPLFLYRKLSAGSRSLLLWTIGFTAYLVVIGGDVLKVHRFFLPAIGAFGTLASLSLSLLTSKLKAGARNAAFAVVAAGFLALTVMLPMKTVRAFNYSERVFTAKMAWLAQQLRQSDRSDFSVATPTIGVFGYELLGHRMIDMLGLTDSTIARHPEDPVPGMATTWKERRHNSKYLLEQAPDYITFSTGTKPSAPAEKALLLYPQFLESYRVTAWSRVDKEAAPMGIMISVFKKVRPVTGEPVPAYPMEFVEAYKRGEEARMANDMPNAVRWYRKAESSLGGRRSWPELVAAMGSCLVQSKDRSGIDELNRAVELDSLTFLAHKDLYALERQAENPTKAAIHHWYLQRLAPWYVPRLDSLVNQALDRGRRLQGR